MKKIYIGFSKPTTKLPLFAWLIQFVEKTPYDHVYIGIEEPMYNNYMIFQASKEMVNLYNPDIFAQTNKTIKEYELSCTDDQYKDIWLFAINNLGTPYGLSQDFGILISKIFKTKQLFSNKTKEEICSELAARVCNILGIKINEDFDLIDPKEMDKILQDAKVRQVL